MKKKCTKCKIEKNENEFHYRDAKREKRKSYCSECSKNYRKSYYDGHRKEAIEYSLKSTKRRKIESQQFIWDYLLENPCVVCKESDPIVLEFDHRDPSNKISSVSDMVNDKLSIKKIKNEIEKCDVLCSNCHKRKTAIQYGWHKNVIKVSHETTQ